MLWFGLKKRVDRLEAILSIVEEDLEEYRKKQYGVPKRPNISEAYREVILPEIERQLKRKRGRPKGSKNRR